MTVHYRISKKNAKVHTSARPRISSCPLIIYLMINPKLHLTTINYKTLDQYSCGHCSSGNWCQVHQQRRRRIYTFLMRFVALKKSNQLLVQKINTESN